MLTKDISWLHLKQPLRDKLIDLKRNSKKELVTAKGIRSRQSSIYVPHQENDFKLSRSKFNDFLTCRRCFYLDRVKGLDSPGTPGWTLNETTDLLLKKEFDICRIKQIPHEIFKKHNLNYLIPYQHQDIDKWRDSLHHGLSIRYQNSNIILSGGVDDIWQDKNTKELIVVDYKSQANFKPLDPDSYLSDVYHEGYKIQMDFYAFLLKEMGFQVGPTAYFLVCNADRAADGFFGKMLFSETLIPYEWDTSWIPKQVEAMVEAMNSTSIPSSNPSCKNCAYANQRAQFL